MENIRELFQIFVRRFGLLNASCCDCCCGEEISLVQSHILFEVGRLHNPSMLQVAEALGMDITTFSRQIKTLERKGLVSKKSDFEDKRVNLLSLTEKGRVMEKRIDQQMQAFIEKIFTQFTDFEKDMVVRSVQLLNKALVKSDICCIPK